MLVVGHYAGDGGLDVVFFDAEIAFRQDYDFGARDAVFLEGFADYALGLAVRVDVGLGRVVSLWYEYAPWRRVGS